MTISIQLIDALKHLEGTIFRIRERYEIPKYKCCVKLDPISEQTSDYTEGAGYSDIHITYNQLHVKVEPDSINKGKLHDWPKVKDGDGVNLKFNCRINPITPQNIEMIDQYLNLTFLAI